MKQLFGIIGNPVKHSLSPAMQMAAFQHLKIDAEYRLFEVKPEQLEGFLLGKISVKDTEGKETPAQEVEGFNITIPYKVKAKEILGKEFPPDESSVFIDPDLYYVKFSGALNTVKREAKSLKYWNTDAAGFSISLWQDLKFKTKGKSVLIVGCGGAGRAIIAALSWKNMGIKKIFISDINEDAINSAKKHFQQLSQSGYLENKLEFIAEEHIARVIAGCDLLVNASPVGMKDSSQSVIDKNLLHKNLFVYDIVYNQERETQLVQDAKSLCLMAVGGKDMLSVQGALSFQKWTGINEPLVNIIQIMRKELEKEVNPVRKDKAY